MWIKHGVSLSHFFSVANDQDRAINKAGKHCTDENVARAKRLRNQVTSLKRNLKRDFCKSAFESAGKDNKKCGM